MKKMIILIILLVFVLNIFLFPQNNLDSKSFACNAVRKGIVEFSQNKYVSTSKFVVFVMRTIKIEETKGEFALSYILSDYEYKDDKSNFFMFVDKHLVIIKADQKDSLQLKRCGISAITDSIKIIALNILAGPNMSITGQPAPTMVFKYKEENLTSTFFGTTPKRKKHKV